MWAWPCADCASTSRVTSRAATARANRVASRRTTTAAMLTCDSRSGARRLLGRSDLLRRRLSCGGSPRCGGAAFRERGFLSGGLRAGQRPLRGGPLAGGLGQWSLLGGGLLGGPLERRDFLAP